jgi:phospholipase C
MESARSNDRGFVTRSSIGARLALAAAATLVAACSSQAGEPSVPVRAQVGARRLTASPITHVVFIIQENRSFNNLFMGFPGANTQDYGYDTNGDKIPLHSQSLATAWDIDHSSYSFFIDCDGTGSLPGTDCKDDGWNNEQAGLGHPANFAYAYIPRKQIASYWKLAQQYVLADDMFASNLDGSFVAHQYAVAAYASRAVDSPTVEWGCWGINGDSVDTLTSQRGYGASIFPCFDNPTIGIDADKAGLSWRFYAGSIKDSDGIWSSYQADRKVFKGSDWKADVVSPPAKFLTDVKRGKLANITWIAPTLVASDHAGLNASQGPAWVASLVDAVGTSSFWNSTAIFIMWDDWGGWFDAVPPVFEDYDGLGFRVPLIIVSPYAKQRSVTHVQYETASVLRYIEDNFGLPQLAKSDARANDPANDPAAFDYGQPPRPFKKIPGDKPAAYWMQLDRETEQRGKPRGIIGDD